MPYPAIAFVDGVGDAPDSKLKEWGQYTCWAPLMAASGYIAVTYESRGPDTVPDIRDLFAHLFQKGGAHGIDPARIGVWACSGNVHAALSYMMEEPRPPVAAAALYYGGGEPASLRSDVPVFLVRAGKDSPFINWQIDRLVARVQPAGAPWTIEFAPGAHHAFDIFDAVEETPALIHRAIACYDRRLKPIPGSLAAVTPERHAIAYGFFQEWSKAAAAWEGLLSKYPGDRLVLTNRGIAQANSDRFQEAIQNLERAKEMGEESPQMMLALGAAYLGARRFDDALATLSKSIDIGLRDRDRLINDPDLASLRDEPRFQSLLERLNR